MKSYFSRTTAIILTTTIFLACTGTEKGSDTSEGAIKQPETAMTEESFDSGPSYQLVWADEFTDDSLNMANWSYQVEPAGRFNDEWQRYTNSPQNAYVEDGKLIIKAMHEGDEHGMDQYTSARLNTAGKQTWQYGKIVARIKLPYGNGIWPAFWLLGANINENGGDTPWPQCGEIDILELYGSKDDGVVEANIHFAGLDNRHGMMGAKSYELQEGKFTDSYHVFELTWDETQVNWSVDGHEYASFDISQEEFSEFHKEFFILLNIAVGGEWAGRPDKTTEFPQYMSVDWVRVYQKIN